MTRNNNVEEAFLSIKIESVENTLSKVIAKIKKLGVKILNGVFILNGDNSGKLILMIDYSGAEYDISQIVDILREKFNLEVEYGEKRLGNFLLPLYSILRIEGRGEYERTLFQNVMLRNLFYVLKKTWGVVGNIFMYHAGTKAGEITAHELSKNMNSGNLKDLLEYLFEFWRLDGFIEDYKLQMDEAGFKVSFYGMFGYDSRSMDIPAFYVKGFLSGFVSEIVNKKPEIIMNEENTRVDYKVRYLQTNMNKEYILL